MFESLTEKFSRTFKRLRGQGKLTESNIKEALREVRLALLEADVHYKVAKTFVADLGQRAVGNEVLESLTPGQQLVKIVNDELTRLMGGTSVGLDLTGRTPLIYLLVGLQGSGKTTTAGKVALYRRELNRHPCLVPADVYRARIHTGTVTQKYIWEHQEIHQEYLPAYAPELNPEEYCHGNVKRYLKNARPEEKRQMQILLNLGFARFRRKPALLLKFFHAAGLSVRQFQLP